MNLSKDHVQSILDSLNGLSEKACNTKQSICDKYSLEYNSDDARISIFAKLINSITSSQYSLMFLGECLLSDKWIAVHHDKTISDENIQIKQQEYYSYIKIAYVQCCFMAIESNFRMILRAIDPNACENSISDFKSIYECLLKTKLSKSYLEFIQLLDLMRLIRNTIHNNGIYFHKSRKDVEIEFDGQKYLFRHSVKLTFVTWPFITKTMDRILTQLPIVLADEQLFSIKDKIIDPFSIKQKAS